jgi:prophage antirepressor-like protein
MTTNILSGTFEDPWFCGQDVCEILGFLIKESIAETREF